MKMVLIFLIKPNFEFGRISLLYWVFTGLVFIFYT